MESVDCDTDTFEYSADIIITNLKIERARKTHIMALTIMLNRNLTRPACSFSLYAEDAKLVHICHGIILFLFIDSSKDKAKFIDKTYWQNVLKLRNCHMMPFQSRGKTGHTTKTMIPSNFRRT